MHVNLDKIGNYINITGLGAKKQDKKPGIYLDTVSTFNENSWKTYSKASRINFLGYTERIKDRSDKCQYCGGKIYKENEVDNLARSILSASGRKLKDKIKDILTELEMPDRQREKLIQDKRSKNSEHIQFFRQMHGQINEKHYLTGRAAIIELYYPKNKSPEYKELVDEIKKHLKPILSTIDHTIARAEEGGNFDKILAESCFTCNSAIKDSMSFTDFVNKYGSTIEKNMDPEKFALANQQRTEKENKALVTSLRREYIRENSSKAGNNTDEVWPMFEQVQEIEKRNGQAGQKNPGKLQALALYIMATGEELADKLRKLEESLEEKNDSLKDQMSQQKELAQDSLIKKQFSKGRLETEIKRIKENLESLNAQLDQQKTLDELRKELKETSDRRKFRALKRTISKLEATSSDEIERQRQEFTKKLSKKEEELRSFEQNNLSRDELLDKKYELQEKLRTENEYQERTLEFRRKIEEATGIIANEKSIKEKIQQLTEEINSSNINNDYLASKNKLQEYSRTLQEISNKKSDLEDKLPKKERQSQSAIELKTVIINFVASLQGKIPELVPEKFGNLEPFKDKIGQIVETSTDIREEKEKIKGLNTTSSKITALIKEIRKQNKLEQPLDNYKEKAKTLIENIIPDSKDKLSKTSTSESLSTLLEDANKHIENKKYQINGKIIAKIDIVDMEQVHKYLLETQNVLDGEKEKLAEKHELMRKNELPEFGAKNSSLKALNAQLEEIPASKKQKEIYEKNLKDLQAGHNNFNRQKVEEELQSAESKLQEYNQLHIKLKNLSEGIDKTRKEIQSLGQEISSVRGDIAKVEQYREKCQEMCRK